MKTLMYVYNSLEHDGRVQRSADAISSLTDLTVISSGSNFKTKNYKSISLDINGLGLKSYMKFIYQLVIYAKNHGPYDVIYAHDYYSTIPSLIILFLKYSKKVIYDAHELYIPDDRDNWNSPREKLFRFFEKRLVKKANGIICANSKRAKLMKDYYKFKINPISIKNIAYFDNDSTDIDFSNAEEEVLEKRGVIRIVYQGSIDISRQIDEFVKVMDKLRTTHELIIVGGGPDLTLLKKMAGSNVHFFGKVNRNKLSLILKRCDIGIVTYPKNGLNNLYCAPNKVYEYAFAGLPIVATENPTLNNICEDYNIGESSDDIITSLLRVSENLHYYKKNLNNFILENSWENEEKKLQKYFSRFL